MNAEGQDKPLKDEGLIVIATTTLAEILRRMSAESGRNQPKAV
jgi:hypothetical protein